VTNGEGPGFYMGEFPRELDEENRRALRFVMHADFSMPMPIRRFSMLPLRDGMEWSGPPIRFYEDEADGTQ
jgi:hypothetical protein